MTIDNISISILGYHPRKPHLRLIRLPTGAVEPFAVHADHIRLQIARILPLKSWVLLDCREEQWATDRRLQGKPRRISVSFDACPDLDGDSIWIQNRRLERTYVRVGRDGVPLEDSVSLPVGSRLDAVTSHGWVIRDERALFLWERGRKPSELGFGITSASKGSLLLIQRVYEDIMAIRDLASGREFRLPNHDGIDELKWSRTGAFSPDGAFLAITANLTAETLPAERMDGDSIVAVFETSTGQLFRCNGTARLPHVPVWSSDNSTIVIADCVTTKLDRILTVDRLERSLQCAAKGDFPIPLIDAAAVL